MIVKELIEKLQEMDQNATVYYADKEDSGYVDFHAMDFDFVTEIKHSYSEYDREDDIFVLLGDKPDPDNDGELVPFSQINTFGMLS